MTSIQKRNSKQVTPPPAAAPASSPAKTATAPAATAPAARPANTPVVAAPQPAPSVPQGSLEFRAGWSHEASGDLVAGGKLTIRYDIARLSSLRHTHNGLPAWGLTGYALFQPSGQIAEGTVLQFKSAQGRPTNDAQGVPLTVDIPAGTTQVQVWFRNWTGADSPREAYDSHFGANYRFPVKQP